MPIRFHRQFTLFPGVKVNVSKTGMSITLGGKGFHLNLSKRGVMQTTNLPGKGLSHRSYIFKNDADDDNKTDDEQAERSSNTEEERPKRNKRTLAKEQHSSLWGFFLFVLVAVFFIYFGGQALGLLPPNLVTDLLTALTQWARQVGL
jgi:uncharacterized protein DUF4236